VVFEDAVNGIKAAVAAGMYPVAILSNAPEAALRAAGAQAAAVDFLQLTPEVRVRLGIR
jgi:beta-phosphoglucomutase-like phosphatase (HAD superfamily)